MNKLYITYNERKGKREFYSYNISNGHTIHTPLNEMEIEAYLTKINRDNIINAREVNNDIMEINLDNAVVIIDNIKALRWNNDNYNRLMGMFLDKIKQFIEDREIKNHTSKRPGIKKVNRSKSKKVPKKMLVTSASLLLSAVLTANLLNAEIKKDNKKDIPDNNSITYLDNNNDYVVDNLHMYSYDPFYENMEYNDDAIQVDFAFLDYTNTGKLDNTINNCSPYMDYWIERYGLPRDLTYALASQEYGYLDTDVKANGASGPMQLQVSAQHKEHYKVPVYEGGVFTGTYDEFWAADKTRVNDTELQGKPLKIIQNLEDNFQIGCAYLRKCIDKYQNIFMAIDAYNKGLYAMDRTYQVCGGKISKPLEYYQNNMDDFSWTSIIPNNSKEVFNRDVYGDPTYIWNVLKYLKTSEMGNAKIEYFCNGEIVRVDLHNTNVYNNELQRG